MINGYPLIIPHSREMIRVSLQNKILQCRLLPFTKCQPFTWITSETNFTIFFWAIQTKCCGPLYITISASFLLMFNLAAWLKSRTGFFFHQFCCGQLWVWHMFCGQDLWWTIPLHIFHWSCWDHLEKCCTKCIDLGFCTYVTKRWRSSRTIWVCPHPITPGWLPHWPY